MITKALLLKVMAEDKRITNLGVHHHSRAVGCEVVEPLSLAGPHVDAAVAHRVAKVVVPVGAMDGMAPVGEVHHPRHVGQIVSRAGHALRLKLVPNLYVPTGVGNASPVLTSVLKTGVLPS